MKGVLMEKKGHHGIFMTHEGAFIKGKHMSKAIGEEFEIEKQAISYRKYLAIAVVVLMLIIGFGPMGVYADPYGFIELDINPSVELAYNKSMKIIRISPLNEDGKALLDGIDVSFKGIALEKAVDILLGKAEVLNYNLNNVVILYTKLGASDETEIEKVIEEINNKNDMMTVLDIDKEAYKKLKENNLPPSVTVLKSKLEEMQVAEEEYVNIDNVNELAHIMNQTKKAEQAEKKQEKENEKNNQGNSESNENKGKSNDNFGGNNNSGNNNGHN
ncbi:MAG TPA: hypothetical protein DDX29_11355 [Clostridiales bacterium]|nr:hypothetical protein [Clostridiales bacterium]